MYGMERLNCEKGFQYSLQPVGICSISGVLGVSLEQRHHHYDHQLHSTYSNISFSTRAETSYFMISPFEIRLLLKCLSFDCGSTVSPSGCELVYSKIYLLMVGCDLT